MLAMPRRLFRAPFPWNVAPNCCSVKLETWSVRLAEATAAMKLSLHEKAHESQRCSQRSKTALQPVKQVTHKLTSHTRGSATHSETHGLPNSLAMTRTVEEQQLAGYSQDAPMMSPGAL